MNILRFFLKPKLSQEAFEAYRDRLPNSISVNWWRDGNFIIGRVSAGKQEFITQGLNSDNFIEMVNDAIYTVYDIPRDYVEVIKKFRTYQPNPEQKRLLENGEIMKAIFSSEKSQEVIRV